jgi:hypothetical protein
MWNRAAFVALFLLGVFSLASCSTEIGTRTNSTQDLLLKNTMSRERFEWRVYKGPDFQVFYGQPKSRKSSGIGIYIGGFPNFHPEKDAKIVEDKLGVFPVVWYETVVESAPKFYRAAAIRCKVNGYARKIHIWVYGDTRTEMSAMADYAAGLTLFTEKPLD